MSDIHPALRATAVASTSTADSLAGAKTIGQLATITEELVASIKSFLIPIEFANDGSPVNFQISVEQLLSILTKASIGLGSVDNTADVDKPISHAVQTELDKKLSSSNLNLTITNIQGLQEVLNGLRSKNVKITLQEVDGLTNALSNKADRTHVHEMGSISGLAEALSRKAASEHNHSLTALNGWNDFITQLRSELANRLTVDTARDLITQEAIVVGVNEWTN